MKEKFRTAIEEDEIAARIADDNRVADVFDDEIKTVALAACFRLSLLQLGEVARQFFIRFAQVCHVAEDRDETDALAARVQGRCRDDLEVQVRSFQRINERDVTLQDLFG